MYIHGVYRDSFTFTFFDTGFGWFFKTNLIQAILTGTSQ
jgi:hypothetical protein